MSQSDEVQALASNLKYGDLERTPIDVQLGVKSASFLIILIFHLKYIWPHRKNLKLGLFRLLDAFLIVIFLRAAIVAIIIINDTLITESGIRQHQIWFYPIQIVLYQSLVIIFLYILFKMKKVEIMLNINDQEPEIVLQRLLKYLNRNRFCIIVFMLEMIIQGFGAVFFTLLDKDILTNMVTVKACTIFMMVNNVFIFFFLSYLVFFFLKMGYFFVKYVIDTNHHCFLYTLLTQEHPFHSHHQLSHIFVSQI